MFVVHVFFQKPELPAYLLPRIGMRFQTFESAKEFYNRYVMVIDGEGDYSSSSPNSSPCAW
jgi:hypothetical protein